MVYKHLLMPWSTSLVSLLSDTRGVSPPTFSAAIEAMLVCVKHGNLDIAHELAAKLECVFGKTHFFFSFVYCHCHLIYYIFFFSQFLKVVIAIFGKHQFLLNAGLWNCCGTCQSWKQSRSRR